MTHTYNELVNAGYRIRRLDDDRYSDGARVPRFGPESQARIWLSRDQLVDHLRTRSEEYERCVIEEIRVVKKVTNSLEPDEFIELHRLDETARRKWMVDMRVRSLERRKAAEEGT